MASEPARVRDVGKRISYAWTPTIVSVTTLLLLLEDCLTSHPCPYYTSASPTRKRRKSEEALKPQQGRSPLHPHLRANVRENLLTNQDRVSILYSVYRIQYMAGKIKSFASGSMP